VFVCAEQDGNILANRKAQKEWESFAVESVKGGVLLKTWHGKYMGVDFMHKLISTELSAASVFTIEGELRCRGNLVGVLPGSKIVVT
jgi:hypothetical protein